MPFYNFCEKKSLNAIEITFVTFVVYAPLFKVINSISEAVPYISPLRFSVSDVYGSTVKIF